jgi:hypothetical protein
MYLIVIDMADLTQELPFKKLTGESWAADEAARGARVAMETTTRPATSKRRTLRSSPQIDANEVEERDREEYLKKLKKTEGFVPPQQQFVPPQQQYMLGAMNQFPSMQQGSQAMQGVRIPMVPMYQPGSAGRGNGFDKTYSRCKVCKGMGHW